MLAARIRKLITARARKKKRTARMFANACKDHSIPLDAVCPFTKTKLFISCQHIVIKKIYNFPEKSELPKSTLFVKNDLFFSAVSIVEIKNCKDHSRLTFSSRGFGTRFRARGYAAHACAPRRVCSQSRDMGGQVIILPFTASLKE